MTLPFVKATEGINTFSIANIFQRKQNTKVTGFRRSRVCSVSIIRPLFVFLRSDNMNKQNDKKIGNYLFMQSKGHTNIILIQLYNTN